jgi:two-component system, OmpR family, heavy metal sensor histidine kinase CusS
VTRRLATAILLITWAALLVISIVVYAAARHVMLTDLDASIVARATALPERLGVSTTPAEHNVPAGDRYVIKNAAGRTIARPVMTLSAEGIEVLDRRFVSSEDGSRQRTLKLSMTPADGNSKPLTVVYSTSAERFDNLLRTLVLWLVAATLGCGAISAWAALVLARITLRPLHETASQIGAIDERHLDRRINTQALPNELAPTAERLNEMLTRLESAFQQRTRFLSEASHELRTPVAALMTTIEVALRRPREADELTKILQACLTDAAALRELVDRLMQQVRSQTKALDESPKRFDLAALLAECADSVDRSQEQRRVEVRMQLPEQLMVISQPGRLRSIVTNLLSNAVEYNREGGLVELNCEVGNELVITVSDTGPGIDTKLLPRLFQPFSRGDAARHAQRHFGLGLSIVQAHLEALAGRCEVESELGKGTRFRVILPADIVSTVETAVGVSG